MESNIRTGTGLLIILLATVVMLVFAWPHRQRADSPQLRNLAAAEELAPGIRALLAKNPRFKDVTIGAYTGQGGAIGIYGWVEKDADLFDLMKLFAEKRYELPLHWGVQVVEGVR